FICDGVLPYLAEVAFAPVRRAVRFACRQHACRRAGLDSAREPILYFRRALAATAYAPGLRLGVRHGPGVALYAYRADFFADLHWHADGGPADRRCRLAQTRSARLWPRPARGGPDSRIGIFHQRNAAVGQRRRRGAGGDVGL